MKKSDCRLILFAKAPIPGQVKTRLIPSLGDEVAAALQERLIFYCLSTAMNAGVGPVDLWCAPSKEHLFFRHCAETFRVNLYTQIEGDLGRRMAHAFSVTLKIAPYVLLIGSDCPSLTQDDLRRAAEVLVDGKDAVLAPAEDGGYALLGLRQYAPDLFSEIPWGTDRVMEETRDRLRQLRWKWHELPERWDVDRPEDVERLMREGLLTQILH